MYAHYVKFISFIYVSIYVYLYIYTHTHIKSNPVCYLAQINYSSNNWKKKKKCSRKRLVVSGDLWWTEKLLSPDWMAQLVECYPAKHRVAGQFTIRAQAWVTVLSLVAVHDRGNQSMFLSHIDVSLPLFLLPFPLSKNK